MRRYVPLILLMIGCKPTAPTATLPPRNLPEDSSGIHPWIADLLEKDISAVAATINERADLQIRPPYHEGWKL